MNSFGLLYIMKPETEVLFMREQTYHIYLDIIYVGEISRSEDIIVIIRLL